MTTEHTPTPWQLIGKDCTSDMNGPINPTNVGVSTPRGIHMVANCPPATSGEETLANAAFIVRACNAHEDLVKRLTDYAVRVLKNARMETQAIASSEFHHWCAVVETLKGLGIDVAAIAKAEGK